MFERLFGKSKKAEEQKKDIDNELVKRYKELAGEPLPNAATPNTKKADPIKVDPASPLKTPLLSPAATAVASVVPAPAFTFVTAAMPTSKEEPEEGPGYKLLSDGDDVSVKSQPKETPKATTPKIAEAAKAVPAKAEPVKEAPVEKIALEKQAENTKLSDAEVEELYKRMMTRSTFDLQFKQPLLTNGQPSPSLLASNLPLGILARAPGEKAKAAKDNKQDTKDEMDFTGEPESPTYSPRF